MATRGRGHQNCRGGGWNNQPSPPAFDQQAFKEVMGAMAAIFVQVRANMGQGGYNNL